MRIAITQDREGNINPRFIDSGALEIYETEGETILRHYPLPLFSFDAAGILQLIQMAKVDAVICRDLEPDVKKALLEENVLLYSGIIGKAETAIGALARGSLKGTASCAHEHEDGACDGNCAHCQHQEVNA